LWPVAEKIDAGGGPGKLGQDGTLRILASQNDLNFSVPSLTAATVNNIDISRSRNSISHAGV
jgi:hypothetical protein